MNDREAIQAAIEAFIAAYNRGDIATVLDYYTDDLIKVRHGAPPESKDDTARRLRAVFESFRTHVEVDNTEIEVSGSIAVTSGTLRVTLTPRDGGERQELSRRYLEIWRRAGGRWRVARTMDNIGPT